MKRVSHWLVLVSLAAGLLALGLGGPAGAQPQKTLVIAIGADQTGLDPQTGQNNESGFVTSTMFGSVTDNTVAKMDVVDEYTLRFTLPDASAPFLSSLAMTWQGIMSPAATKQYNCDASQHPVGTGPFKFVEAVRNDHITLDANPDYWGGRPKVDRIIFKIVPESATRMLMLERNEVQILADVPPSDYARAQNNKALQLYRH